MAEGAASPTDSWTSGTTTYAPASAKTSAMARPMPWAAPVTIATLLVRSYIFVWSGRVACQELAAHTGQLRPDDGVTAEVGDVHHVALIVTHTERHVRRPRQQDGERVVC